MKVRFYKGMELVLNIPTKGRVGLQRALDLFPTDFREWIHVWCPVEEIAAHHQQPYAAKVSTFHGETTRGIALSWQGQLDYAVMNGIDWMWIWEDDIYRIDHWSDSEVYDLRRCDETGLMGLIDRALDFFESGDYAMVGISNRGRSHKEFPIREQEATRMHGTWAVHVPTLKALGFRFDEFGGDFYMGDFHCQLCLLEAGYRTVRIQDYCWSQQDSNAPGGASDTRTAEKQRRTAEQLQKAHPHVVELRVVRANSWGRGNRKNSEMVERMDVLVRWKRAHLVREM